MAYGVVAPRRQRLHSEQFSSASMTYPPRWGRLSLRMVSLRTTPAVALRIADHLVDIAMAARTTAVVGFAICFIFGMRLGAAFETTSGERFERRHAVGV